MNKLVISYSNPRMKKGQHYPVAKNKIAIILHHTAGSSFQEAVNWWNQTPEVVGTALGVDRDGKALQCFEINQWAYHMGLNLPKVLKDRFEEQTIGIEISSYGWVLKEGDKFYAYPNWPDKKRKVLIDEKNVIELREPWKGYKFWHKYTDEQIETVVQLCRYLVKRFGIKVQNNLMGICDYNIDVAREARMGIYTHNTVRKDKFDIYPDPRLLEALNKEFNPKQDKKSEEVKK